jgi:hypothetical protein
MHELHKCATGVFCHRQALPASGTPATVHHPHSSLCLPHSSLLLCACRGMASCRGVPQVTTGHGQHNATHGAYVGVAGRLAHASHFAASHFAASHFVASHFAASHLAASNLNAAACPQNYGLRDGLPGTVYHRAVAARNYIEQYLQPRIEAAVADRKRLGASDSVVARLLKGLEEEGLDITSGSDRCSPPHHMHSVHSCCASTPASRALPLLGPFGSPSLSRLDLGVLGSFAPASLAPRATQVALVLQPGCSGCSVCSVCSVCYATSLAPLEAPWEAPCTQRSCEAC